jgi:catechol 2,3-dioxygenase-like lactoylglutathione lyase family enzyme
MSISGFSHVAIGIRDAERSIPFYRDVLGLTVSLDVEERGERTPFHRRAVYLRWDRSPDDRFIVLDQHLDRPPKGEAKALFEVGVHHFAFAVSNIEAIVARAEAAGVWVSPGRINTYSGLAYGVAGDDKPAVRTAILKDPDGNIIQLDEWLEPPR